MQGILRQKNKNTIFHSQLKCKKPVYGSKKMKCLNNCLVFGILPVFFYDSVQTWTQNLWFENVPKRILLHKKVNMINVTFVYNMTKKYCKMSCLFVCFTLQSSIFSFHRSQNKCGALGKCQHFCLTIYHPSAHESTATKNSANSILSQSNVTEALTNMPAALKPISVWRGIHFSASDALGWWASPRNALHAGKQH